MIEGSGRRVADPATRKLRPLDRNRAWRRAAGAALALATAAAWHLMSDDSAARFASFALWALVLAGCLQVGPRHAASILALSLLTALGLDWINRTKIDLTQAPLTALDIRIALQDPFGLWIALGWPEWTLSVLIGVSAALVLLVGFVAARAARRRGRAGGARRSPATAWLPALAVLAASVSVAVRLPGRLEAVALRDDGLWEPAGLARYSRIVGTVPFLLFSAVVESRDTGPFYDPRLTASPAPRTEVHAAVQRYVNVSMLGRVGLPNIVVLFAESTFDPDRAFRLTKAVGHPLFARQSDSGVVTPLFVNAVGGGSWISEFETIVGLDSRLLGYAGYYTHATIAPFVRRSLATHLAERGYDTAAYYAWSGDFYNSRRAYGRYGFRRFLDGDELGLKPQADDRDIAELTVARANDLQRQPFFSYVAFTGNHSPHACAHYRSSEDLSTSFSTPVPFEMNCELNEFVRRLDSTWFGFETWARYLQDLRRATGRDYVLAMFGDHQPHTFVGLGQTPPFSTHNYAPVRTERSPRETFLHIRTSIPGVLECCDREPPPATLLPTLLSAFAARTPDDVYLPENLYLYRACGSDAIGRDPSTGIYGPGSPSGGRRSAACEDAYLRGISSLRRAGVLAR